MPRKKKTPEARKETKEVKFTTKQKNEFMVTGLNLAHIMLISAYKAFEKHAKDLKQVTINEEVVGIMRHVAFIAEAVQPVRETIINKSNEYADLYRWMDTMVKNYTELIQNFALNTENNEAKDKNDT